MLKWFGSIVALVGIAFVVSVLRFLVGYEYAFRQFPLLVLTMVGTFVMTWVVIRLVRARRKS